MIPDKKLSEIFGQFAGREVDALEVVNKHTMGGTEHPLTHVVVISYNDPALAELYQFAAKKGYTVRVWTEGTRGTTDYIETCLNVDVAKETDGKFRIQPNFRLG